jgi:hypothetical protein
MAFPLAIPVALSAIQALIKFRGRLDTILSLNETTKGLPFALPPAPQFDAPHIDPMVEFFQGDVGKNILVIRGLLKEWRTVQPNPRSPEVQAERAVLLAAYYEAKDIQPQRLGPGGELGPDPRLGSDPAQNRLIVSRGPSQEMRLAYYVVESHRLSRNPAVTRVLLAAADTLLEFGAENASMFVSDPRTRGLVETLLREFAVERDWDDASGEVIFKTLLGAAAVAALENRGSLPDQPILQALFDALGDVQQEMGADFVANLITKDGFRKLVGRFLIQAADQPGLLPDKPVLKESLVAMLRVTGENLDGILGDPKALAGVLEAGIAAAAGAAVTIIDEKLGDEPLLAVVLQSVATEFKTAGDDRVLFRKIGNGELFTALYQASLRSVASNSDALASQAKLNKHVATLISAFADELSKKKLIDALSADTVRSIAVRALEVVGRDPTFLGIHGEFAAKIVGAVLTATADALKDGLTTDDLMAIAEETLRVASTNLNLVEMDDHLRVVLEALGATLADKGLSSLTTGRGRKELFFSGLEAISTNPRVWQGFAEKDLVEPLVTGLIRSFAINPGNLLAGTALVPAFQQVLKAAASRGQSLLDGNTTPEALETLLEAALKAANKEIGASIDGDTLPTFLRRVVTAFLASPFDPETKADLGDWLKARLPEVA